MSDMGGAMGMCLGFSFITVLEFVELFADCVVLLLAKCRSGGGGGDGGGDGGGRPPGKGALFRGGRISAVEKQAYG